MPKVRCKDCWHIGHAQKPKFGKTDFGCYAFGKWAHIGHVPTKLIECDLFEENEVEWSGITYTGYGQNTHAPSGN